MARILPLRSEASSPDAGPRVLDLEEEATDEVFSALSSDTARTIFRRLHDEPMTPSDIAEAADTSIQNVRYHLDNLEEAGLVEVVDTWYSSRGNEMSVYAPSSDALVFTSDEESASQLRTALSRLVGAVGALALASFVVQQLATTGGGGGGGGGGPAATTDGGIDVQNVTATTATAAGDASGSAAGAEPGLLFFAGGLVVLVAAVAYLSWRGI